jgi:hypothetical protein
MNIANRSASGLWLPEQKLDVRTYSIPFLPVIFAEVTATHATHALFKLGATCSHITNIIMKMVGKHSVISVAGMKLTQQRRRECSVRVGEYSRRHETLQYGNGMERDN